MTKTNSNADRFRKQAIAADLEEPVTEARNLAQKLGLEPYPVKYWIIDYDEMNELIAYGGFQSRYPHWRWGMQYDKQQKQGQYGGGKAFEIVNNDNPAHAFLQESNTVADQKAVITHVEAHSDFFANNDWFGMFTRGQSDEGQVNAAAMLERHARAIDEYMSDPEIDRAEVEKWIDHCLSLEDNIDQHQVFTRRLDVDGPAGEIDEDLAEKLDELELSDEIKGEVFNEEWIEKLEDEDITANFPDEPQKDVLAFVREHGKQYDEEAGRGVEMAEWQRDILDMMRAEAYYFAAQKMTKVMNEGWACVDPETPIFTADGLVPMREVVDNHTTVSDGETTRNVYDANIIPDHDTVTIETRRGFELTGSNNHRIRLPDGSWSRLDELSVGDEIEVSGGNDTWSSTYVDLEWEPPESVTLDDIADEAGVSVWTVMRYRRVGRARKADAIEDALSKYEGDHTGLAQRGPIAVPDTIDEQMGRFLGLLVGDGHVSSSAGHVGFTNGEKRHAEEFAGLVDELFGIDPTVEKQDGRWRVYAYSRNLVELLQEALGMPDGKAAGNKTVPDSVLRSPRSVVAEFLRGLFDADGYAGEQGAILTTKSEEMSKEVLLLLANFGILARRREQTDSCYHVHLTGESAQTFADEIGFGYPEKEDALRAYLDDLSWFEDENWTDEIVSIAESTGTVYDVSVEETHRYAGAGVINHNSYWESTMMTDETFAGDDEFVNYADHMAKVLGAGGLNPYSLGMELWEYVENTTNRREVLERLLRIEGVSWRNLSEVVDFDAVLETLEPPEAIETITPDTLDQLEDVPDEWIDHEALERARAGEIDVSKYPWKVLTYEGLARRHYSLVKRQHRGFLARVNQNELERIGRYLFDDARYASVEEALEDVEYTAGWDRLFDVRESHNDVTFLDEFLTQEFITENNYFTYEHSQATGQFHVTSDAAEDVKKKLLLQFTNFGKPTVAVYDGNYNNANELLLGHQYNGVMLDLAQAKETLKRIFELWGRPVNLLTIVKEVDDHDIEVAKRRNREPEPEEQGKLIRYDGQTVTTEDVPWEEVEHLAADDVDYDTKPDEWLA